MNRNFDSSFRFASLDDAELDAITGGGDVLPATTTETLQLAAGFNSNQRWSPSVSVSPSPYGSLERAPSELAIIGDYGHGPAMEHLTEWYPSQITPHDPTGPQSGAVSDHGGGESYGHPYDPTDLHPSSFGASGSGAHPGYEGMLEQMGIDPNAVPVQGSSGGETTPGTGNPGFAAGDGGCYSGGGHGTPVAVSDASSNGCDDAPVVENGCGGGGGRHC